MTDQPNTPKRVEAAARPWFCVERGPVCRISSRTRHIVDFRSGIAGDIHSTVEQRADAALIVQVANAHDRLVEACQAAQAKIEAYEGCSPAAEVIAADDMPEEWELCRAALATVDPDDPKGDAL